MTSLETSIKTDPAPIATTVVDIVIRLQIEGSPSQVAAHRAALAALADIMRVQAEDGLWTLGYEDAESRDVPNEHLADIHQAAVQSILINGHDESP